MDIIEKLIAGHRDVSEKKDLLEKLIKAVESDAFFWDKPWDVAFFFNKEIREHFMLEEKVLFPVLKKALFGGELANLKEIEAEHNPILRKLDGFKVIYDNYLRFSSKATKETMFKSAFELMETISAHAKKEDKKLFPLVKDRLQPENLREMEDLYFKFLKV